MEAFIPESPFVRHLGMTLGELGQDRAELLLPFSEQVVTIGDVVHGGAISTLIDTAGTAAAWADGSPAGEGRGSTVSLSVDFVSAAHGEDLTARAAVIRRGKSLVFCEIDVVGEAGQIVAK